MTMGLSFYAKISKLSPEHNKKPFRKQILRFQFSIENDDSANTTANHIIPVLKPNTRFSIHHQIFKCIKNNRVKNSITLRVAFPFAALEMGLILLLCKSKEKEKSRKNKYRIEECHMGIPVSSPPHSTTSNFITNNIIARIKK